MKRYILALAALTLCVACDKPASSTTVNVAEKTTAAPAPVIIEKKVEVSAPAPAVIEEKKTVVTETTSPAPAAPAEPAPAAPAEPKP
jgi:hypothetical protein